LIITFFVMIIILAVVLSISVLLYSEVKIIKNMSDSVVAFYAADSGAEKALYYDRQVIIHEGVVRGICDICESGCGTDCSDCSTTGSNCEDCKDCTITFKTTMATTPQKYYDATVNVSTLEQDGSCPLSVGQLKSVGTYLNTSRAVNLDITGDVKTSLGPGVGDNGTIFIANQSEEIIHIHVLAPEDLSSVEAYIYYSPIDPANGGAYTLDTHTPNPVNLSYNNGQKEWQGDWNAHETGWFYVGIGVTDPINGYCTSIVITSG